MASASPFSNIVTYPSVPYILHRRAVVDNRQDNLRDILHRARLSPHPYSSRTQGDFEYRQRSDGQYEILQSDTRGLSLFRYDSVTSTDYHNGHYAERGMPFAVERNPPNNFSYYEQIIPRGHKSEPQYEREKLAKEVYSYTTSDQEGRPISIQKKRMLCYQLPANTHLPAPYNYSGPVSMARGTPHHFSITTSDIIRLAPDSLYIDPLIPGRQVLMPHLEQLRDTWQPCCVLILGLTQLEYDNIERIRASGERNYSVQRPPHPDPDVERVIQVLDHFILNSMHADDSIHAAHLQRLLLDSTPPFNSVSTLAELVRALDLRDLEFLELVFDFFELNCSSVEAIEEFFQTSQALKIQRSHMS